jgi:hypothetical protein
MEFLRSIAAAVAEKVGALRTAGKSHSSAGYRCARIIMLVTADGTVKIERFGPDGKPLN